MTKYAVVGSRDFNDYSLLERELDNLNITQIISGGARGTDTLASRYAHEKRIPLVEFKPDYQKHGRGAPLVRNRTIVDKSEAVIAFWDKQSRGTAYTIDYAKKNNKPVKIVKI